MTQGDSRRGFVHSLEFSQQSIYEDDNATEHGMPCVVALQEIDKSSSVVSVSNPYPLENGYSRATSQESANLYSASSQDVGDLMELDHETANQYQMIVIPEDQHDPPALGRNLANPTTSAELPVPPKRKSPVIHHPKNCPDSSARTDARDSQTSNTNGSRTLAISADEASQAIASELSKSRYQNQEEMELVIRASVLSLMSDSRNRKLNPQNPPCTKPKDSENGLKCQYCHKQKKTQCDLT